MSSDEIKTFELQTVLCPITTTAKEIRRLFGIAPTALKRLADQGKVRWAKAGDAEQAGRVYVVSDVKDWLGENLQGGNKKPRPVSKPGVKGNHHISQPRTEATPFTQKVANQPENTK